MTLYQKQPIGLVLNADTSREAYQIAWNALSLLEVVLPVSVRHGCVIIKTQVIL